MAVAGKTGSYKGSAPTTGPSRPQRSCFAGLSDNGQPMFSIPIRVYWEDTDAGGVVYHARYVAFLERARSDALRDLGRGQQALQQAGLVFAVHSMRLEFLRPARLDDLLEVTAEVARVGRASVVFTHDFSDWSTMEDLTQRGAVYWRVVRQKDSIEARCSLDGEKFVTVRQGYFPAGQKVMVGVMCCAPEGQGFDATFDQLLLDAV